MIRRAPRADVAILLVTFGLTVFADLVVAVNIGVVLAMLHFLRRMAASVKVHEQTDSMLRQEFAYEGFDGLPSGVAVYSIEGPFFFGAVESFEQALAAIGADSRVVIVRLRQVPFIDATGLQTLEQAVQALRKRHIAVVFTEANARVHRKLDKMGLIEKAGGSPVTETFSAALARVRNMEKIRAENRRGV